MPGSCKVETAPVYCQLAGDCTDGSHSDPICSTPLMIVPMLFRTLWEIWLPGQRYMRCCGSLMEEALLEPGAMRSWQRAYAFHRSLEADLM